MHKMILALLFLLVISSVVAYNPYSSSHQFFSEQMRERFRNPDGWKSSAFVENNTGFMRNQQLNQIYAGVYRPPRTEHVRPPLRGSPNIDMPVLRHGLFDRTMEPVVPFRQQNNYIVHYQEHLYTGTRVMWHTPVSWSIFDTFKLSGRTTSTQQQPGGNMAPVTVTVKEPDDTTSNS